MFLRLQDTGHPEATTQVPEGVRLLRWPTGTPGAEDAPDIAPLLPAFRTVLREVQPDLVHAGPIPTCAFLAALAETHPLLAMSWGSDLLLDLDHDEPRRRAAQTVLARADAVACDCNTVREKIHELATVPDERIVQFPWGVDLTRFSAGPDSLRLRERPGWEDGMVMLSTRAWEPIYGTETLLEAFRRARGEVPQLRLVLLGGGSLAPKLHAFLRDHGLRDAVHAPGAVPNEQVRDYFRAAGIYVSASRSDGTSVSLLEAMATGLPAVVSDIPANREWVVPGENGWFAPVGDADAFARCLVAVARATPAERRRIASTNRAVAEARADWTKNSKILLRAYEHLAPRGAR